MVDNLENFDLSQYADGESGINPTLSVAPKELFPDNIFKLFHNFSLNPESSTPLYQFKMCYFIDPRCAKIKISMS